MNFAKSYSPGALCAWSGAISRDCFVKYIETLVASQKNDYASAALKCHLQNWPITEMA